MREQNSGKITVLSIDKAIRLANRGDDKGFESIYRTYCEFVRRLCIRMLKDPVEAEDVAQDVFVCVFRKINTFRGESAFSSWLYRLTTNIVLMRFRKNKHRCIPLEDCGGDDGDFCFEISAPDLSLAGLLDRIDLKAAVDALPDSYKTAFTLHDVEGYNHREIAQIFGYSVENSKSKLHRARLKLRKLLVGKPRKSVQRKDAGR